MVTILFRFMKLDTPTILGWRKMIPNGSYWAPGLADHRTWGAILLIAIDLPRAKKPLDVTLITWMKWSVQQVVSIHIP